MKKNLLYLIAFFIIMFGYSQNVGSTFIHNNITYSITSISPNTVKVIDYNINGGVNVVIPASVTPNASSKFSDVKTTSKQLATYAVTAIASNAFFSKGIYSVVIPDSVLTIGNQAFAVNYITTASLGNGVTSIGFNAFYNNNLTTIIIPDSVIEIQDRAFDDNLLTSVTIPSNVQTIGTAAFRGNLITCVTSKATIPPTIVTDGSGISDSFNVNRSGIKLYIPSGTAAAYSSASWTGFNSVTETQGNTFVSNYITYQITSANTVTTTDYNTAGGTIVNIPATVEYACKTYNVTVIGNFSFHTNSLTSVTIPDTVISIGEGAFNNNSINNLILGNNVEIIGGAAFQYNNLTSVTIPNSVITISMNAFRFGTITNLYLGNSVETIGNSAFADNDLSSLVIPNSVLTIGDWAFVYSDSMSSLVLGNSLTSIGDFAFSMNAVPSNQLTSITIPSSVTNIGKYAFSIASLTDVTSLATTPPTIITGGTTTDTFSIYRSNINLHIPTGTMGAYVTNPGALWTNFASVTEGALSTDNFELENGIKVINTINSIKIVSNTSIPLKNYSLYTISGQKVTTGTDSNISTIPYTSGIYILKLYFNEGNIVTKKILID